MNRDCATDMIEVHDVIHRGGEQNSEIHIVLRTSQVGNDVIIEFRMHQLARPGTEGLMHPRIHGNKTRLMKPHRKKARMTCVFI